MVRSIIYTVVAIALCIGVFIGTEIFITKQFSQFNASLQTLYDKIEEETATREDAYAVRTMWSDKKKKLQVFIPHNDVSYIDYWLSEACALIYNDEYDLALGKIEVLLEITKNLPDAYNVKLENVF
ncbi:MAG: DUF4363 family protein [Clostridia bacterium]|nr:DUF4363 family protein [Clostridia bacterium]